MRNFRQNWLNLARGTIIFLIKRRSGWPVPAVAAAVAVGRIIIILLLLSLLFSSGGRAGRLLFRTFTVYSLFIKNPLKPSEVPLMCSKGLLKLSKGFKRLEAGVGSWSRSTVVVR